MSSVEVVPLNEASPVVNNDPRPGLIRAIGNRLRGCHESQEQLIEQLTFQAAEKLMQGIAEKGMVSLFHDEINGELESEIYSARFTSPDIESLEALVYRYHTERAWRGERGLQLYMQILQHRRPGQHYTRCLNITRRYGDGPGEYGTTFKLDEYGRGGEREMSTKEKISFLKQILATEVDEAATEEKFGSPYSPGGTRSSTLPGDGADHNAYWVRDLEASLEGLTMSHIGAEGEEPAQLTK